MCDFRQPEDFGPDFEALYKGPVAYNKSHGEHIPTFDEVSEPGYYHVVCTGGHYKYFDGETWMYYDKGPLKGLENVEISTEEYCSRFGVRLIPFDEVTDFKMWEPIGEDDEG